MAIEFVGADFPVPLDRDVTFTVPAEVVAGDLLIAFVSHEFNAAPRFTTPAGFTAGGVFEAASSSIEWWWKVSDGTEQTVVADYSSGGTPSSGGALVAYRGTDAAGPIDAFGAAANGTADSITAPSVQASTETWVVCLYGADDKIEDLSPITVPSGATLRGNSPGGGQTSVIGIDFPVAAAGATAAQTINVAQGAEGIGLSIALTPAPLAPFRMWDGAEFVGLTTRIWDGAAWA